MTGRVAGVAVAGVAFYHGLSVRPPTGVVVLRRCEPRRLVIVRCDLWWARGKGVLSARVADRATVLPVCMFSWRCAFVEWSRELSFHSTSCLSIALVLAHKIESVFSLSTTRHCEAPPATTAAAQPIAQLPLAPALHRPSPCSASLNTRPADRLTIPYRLAVPPARARLPLSASPAHSTCPLTRIRKPQQTPVPASRVLAPARPTDR